MGVSETGAPLLDVITDDEDDWEAPIEVWILEAPRCGTVELTEVASQLVLDETDVYFYGGQATLPGTLALSIWDYALSEPAVRVYELP